MKYYVVADVHGFYTELREALEAKGFFADTEPHKLIVCGDMLDRGPEAVKLSRFMVDLLDKDELIFIQGNHEDLLMQCLQDIAHGGIYQIAGGWSHHYTNGTFDTLLQLSGMDERQARRYPNTLIERVRDHAFCRRLLPVAIDYYETPHYVFTHGWIPCHTAKVAGVQEHTYDPDWRQADVEAWQAARWYNGMDAACVYRATEPSKTIVCGHWRSSYGHCYFDHNGTDRGERAVHTPFYADGIIAIDATTVVSGVVNCLVIED